jgi:hypothetical protein
MVRLMTTLTRTAVLREGSVQRIRTPVKAFCEDFPSKTSENPDCSNRPQMSTMEVGEMVTITTITLAPNIQDINIRKGTESAPQMWMTVKE